MLTVEMDDMLNRAMMEGTFFNAKLIILEHKAVLNSKGSEVKFKWIYLMPLK